jgi:hypothetical protein
MKFRGAVLLVAVGLVGCVASPPSPAPGVFDQLVGQWDEVHPGSCESTHTISFDRDKSMMMVEYDEVGWVTESDSRKVFRYRILGAKDPVLRTQLENEPRLDDQGKPVVWHIVVVDADTYCWGRDDWPQGACTTPRKRCKP